MRISIILQTYRRWNSFLDGRTEAKDQSKNERSESGFDSISEQAIQEVSEAANMKVVIPAKPTRAPPKIPIQGFFYYNINSIQ